MRNVVTQYATLSCFMLVWSCAEERSLREPATSDTEDPSTGPSTGVVPPGDDGFVPPSGGGNTPGTTPPAVPPAQPSCTNTPPDARQTCETWKAWGECDKPWLQDFCDESCGRCRPGAGGTPGGDTEPPPKPDLGDDNPYPPLQGGSEGWASRYWDCCKPSCGWKGNASRPVASCDIRDNGLGVTEETNSCDVQGTRGAFTCHSMAPSAHSNQLAYGYAAFNGAKCGTCFQLEFTGGSFNAGNDPGSQKLTGKTMVVQVSNIGGIQQGQFDLLIPGGGVGDFNACSGQWGVPAPQLGARYGGLLSDCRASSQDHEAVKNCMRGKCQSVFATRGLSELNAGCLWFVDWFEAADNPALRFKEVSCPSELGG